MLHYAKTIQKFYLLLVFLRSRHQSRDDLDFAQILERPRRICKLQVNFLRHVELELIEVELCGSHEIIGKAEIVVETLKERNGKGKLPTQ